jgi:uncharacterized membrane protein YebE (DUF533 family)
MADLNASMKSVLDRLMAGGQDLYRKGEDAAAGRLGYGDDAESRKQMRNTALAGGAAAGVLGLLLGTRGGRSVARTGLVLGGLGYLGKMAYDAYQKHAGGAAQADAQPAGELAGPQAEARGAAILVAMIAAAKADGHIDAAEKKLITDRVADLGAEAQSVLMDELSKPLDPVEVASHADSDQARREVYAVSVMVCGADHAEERAYLDRLAGALGLAPALAAEIERSVAAA